MGSKEMGERFSALFQSMHESIVAQTAHLWPYLLGAAALIMLLALWRAWKQHKNAIQEEDDLANDTMP